MQYIAYKRFKAQPNINIPAGTKCETIGETIYCNNQPICQIRSKVGHQYFTQNEDNKGMWRGALICAIQQKLAHTDAKYQERWDKVAADQSCQKYKRTEYADMWLWNHDFYNAPISDLQYIAKLIDLKVKE